MNRRYLLCGEPATVPVRFALPSKRNPPATCPVWLRWTRQPGGAPRNALVVDQAGRAVVRPFRGLRRDHDNRRERA